MQGKILHNGIYFNQSDMKVDGYYTTNDLGISEKHKYVKPSIWEKVKHQLKYGYELNTETITTSFFHFSDHLTDRVYFASIMGDAISTAKSFRKSEFSVQTFHYCINDKKMIVDLENCLFDMIFSENGRTIETIARDKISDKFISRDTFTFLEWDNI